MQVIVRQMISGVGYYENAFPSHPPALWVVNTSTDFANTVDPGELIAYFYPDATLADSATLVTALADDTITSTDFLTGWLPARLNAPQPTAADVLDEIFEAGLGTPTLPDIDLGLPGVTAAQTTFLIGIYLAAFDRAPEHAGLAYWAGDLARLLAAGMSEADAMKQMAKAMYVSGAENGENGTALDDAAYVHFVYDTVLDREPDAGGARHWIDELQAGADRSELIAVFLTSALEAAGDSDYVKARVAVAEYVAQAHVSGPGRVIDLAAAVADIDHAGDAYLAIRALARDFPVSGSAARLFTMATEDDISLPGIADMAFADVPPLPWDGVPTPDIAVVGVALDPDAPLL